MSHLPPFSTMGKKICFPCRLRVKEETLGLALSVFCGTALYPRVPPVVSHNWSRSVSLNLKVFDSQTLFPKEAFSFKSFDLPELLKCHSFLSACPCPLCTSQQCPYLHAPVCILVLDNWMQAINYSPSPALSQPSESFLSLPLVSLVKVSSVQRGWMKTSLCRAA